MLNGVCGRKMDGLYGPKVILLTIPFDLKALGKCIRLPKPQGENPSLERLVTTAQSKPWLLRSLSRHKGVPQHVHHLTTVLAVLWHTTVCPWGKSQRPASSFQKLQYWTEHSLSGSPSPCLALFFPSWAHMGSCGLLSFPFHWCLFREGKCKLILILVPEKQTREVNCFPPRQLASSALAWMVT